MDAFHSQCPTLMSTVDRNNGNSSQISFPVYHAISSNQLQVPPPVIIPTTGKVFLLTGNIPRSCSNLFHPCFTNVTPIQNIQIPKAAIPNFAKEIDCPPDAIKNKFDLMPEIPQQIFTLPFLQLKTSESNNILDRNSVTSNMEQPSKPNKVAELAKISDYSKKIPLSVEIPETLSPKSLFPLYSTPPGGNVLKPLKLPSDQLPATSNYYFGSPFASLRGIHPMGISAQTTSYGVSCNSPVVIGQAIPQPTMQHNINIQSRSEEGNPIQPVIQAHIMEQSIVQQPFMQNRNLGPQYLDPDPVYMHTTQYPLTMTNLNTAPQY